MIHPSAKFILQACLFVSSPSFSSAQKDNGSFYDTSGVMFLYQGDAIKGITGKFALLVPDPLQDDTARFDPEYIQVGKLSLPQDSASLLIKPGVQYLIPEHYFNHSRYIPSPPHRVIKNAYQIVVKSRRDYLGYLEELLNVPFMLPPKFQGAYGHQTDNRIAVDCAEMAIYGMRRMGYSVPYCGPLNIYKYLVPADTLLPGTVLHFGHQVSVLYQDNGTVGVLDGQDLLIHAYRHKAEIIPLEKTDLKPERCRVYQWNTDLFKGNTEKRK